MGHTKNSIKNTTNTLIDLLYKLDLNLEEGEVLPYNFDDLLKQFSVTRNVCTCTDEKLFHCVNGHCFNCGLITLEGFPHLFKEGENKATGNFFRLKVITKKLKDGNNY